MNVYYIYISINYLSVTLPHAHFHILFHIVSHNVTIPLLYQMCIVIAIPPRVELESNYSLPTASNDSISATAVGLLLGGLVAGVIGVLLIEGIVCVACRLRKIKHK